MNRLDILPQNMARPADAQSARNSGQALENRSKAGEPSEQGGFGALLDGMTGGAKQDDEVSTRTASDGILADPLGEALKDGSEEDLLQMLLSDEAQASSSSGQGQVPPGNAALSLLEGLLPRVLAQVAPGDRQDSEKPGAMTRSPFLSIDGEAGESLGLLTPKSALQISVQSQETHFKPIIDSLSVGDGTSNNGSADGEVAVPDDLNIVKVRAVESEKSQSLTLPSASVSSAGNNVPQGHTAEGLGNMERAIGETFEKQTDVVKQAAGDAKADETTTLPAATLHRMAGSVASEARSMAAEAGTQAHRADNLFQQTSVKASTSVLRVLNLQLHPAELGLVTIKMKLSGDSLEMELQVENEETARMLQNDTEKLSSLLKGSGYRPDVINIQTAEFTPQDRMATSRQPSPMQASAQTFDQSASNSNNGSRQQEQSQRYEGAGALKDAKEDTSSTRSAGGIYL